MLAWLGGKRCAASEYSFPPVDRACIGAPVHRVIIGCGRQLIVSCGVAFGQGLLPGVVRRRMTAEGSIRSPLEPRCAGHPFVPSVARGVGNKTSVATNGSTCCDSGGRNPVPACRPGVPVSEARGVGRGRVWSGSDGPPCCARWVQFLASDAVGVGSSRRWSSREGPPCLLAALIPLEVPSCAVGVGIIRVVMVGPGEEEDAFSLVRGADVAGANASPCRVIPCFGQVAEYSVQAAVFPAERGDVFHDEQWWS